MTFDPASVPAGCELRLVPFWRDRPLITPRSMLSHTMAARVRSSVASAYRHATAVPGTNTLPHYALGLDSSDGCAKFLQTNRRGIANATVTRSTKDSAGRLIWPTLTDAQRASIDAHGNIRNWSLAIETADTGTDADPTISAFTNYQLEMLVRIYVHEFGGWRIAPVPLSEWWSAGAATHTDPHGFPFTTIHRGKFCPGSKKKAQFWTIVLPEVASRLHLPTPTPAPAPTPPEDDEMVDADDINGVWVAPPPNAVGVGSDNLVWLNAVIAKVGSVADVQRRRGLKVTGIYDTATQAGYNAELAAMKTAAGK